MDINVIRKDLEELEAAQERLENEKNATIINFFNEEYGAGFSADRYFECIENLFSEDEDGYLDPYDLRLGWDEVRLFLYWQTIHDYNLRQRLTAEALEMLTSKDEHRRNHGKNGILVADSGIEKSMDELQKIVDSAKSAIDRLNDLKQLLNKYKKKDRKTQEAIMEYKKRILIADNSAKFCDELTQALTKCGCYEIAGTANDGEQAVKLVKKTTPDVLVLDLMLAKLDGLSVLKQIYTMENQPVVVATSKFITDYVASASANLGARYLMLKPCDVDVLIERIEESCVSKRLRDEARKASETKVEKLVTEILHDIGVPAHIKGYQYLREAIIIATENIDILNEGAKALYGQIAKIFQTTPNRVVRALQHAIDVVWEKGDHVVIEKHCGYLGGKPNPSQFIEALAEDVQWQLDKDI